MAKKKFNPLTPPFDLTADSVNDLTDHNKVAHDALGIDADTLDGKHASEFASSTPPTGTGFRHITAGVEDAAAKLVENVDVEPAAGIEESKLALNYPTHSNALDHSNANDPSADEKAALVGTSGTPSATNPFVTDSDSRFIETARRYAFFAGE